MAAIPTQGVTITSLGGGVINLQAGPEGLTFHVSELTAIYEGVRDYRFLLWEVAKRLRAAGVHPGTSTPAQVKAAVEAVSYPWGA